MISAIKLKRCVASIGILGVIIGKHRHGKKPCLIILLKVDKGLKINFHRTILPLSLAVYLWVKGDGESPLDAKEIV